MENELKVNGALMAGYAQACMNLHIVAGKKALDFINDIQMDQWYSLSKWVEMERIVMQSYENADPIMLRVGVEMMLAWYHFGPGKQLVKTGVDFLNFQTSSGGIASVVQGPKELVGDFTLKEINETQGKAVVHSTTPFNRKMECGVLIGGMLAPGDLDYVDAYSESNEDLIYVEFH